MRFFILFVILLFSAPTVSHAEWRKAVSPSFVVYGDMKEAPLLAFTKKVERFDTFLRRKFGIAGESAPARMTIFITNSSTPVGSLIAGKNDKFIKGFYTNGPNGPVAILQQTRGEGQFDLDADTILFHEYVHHFMLQYFPAAYPAWFVEGFAEFYSTTEFNKGGFASYGRPAYHRAYELVAGKDLAIEKLLVTDVDALKEGERSSLYARGWLLTHYLTFAPDRDGQLSVYIAAINNGVDGLDAARKAFGDLAALNKGLNAYRDKNSISYLTQREVTPASDAIVLTLVEAGEAATMIERIKVRRHVTPEERPALIASLTNAKKKFPNSVAINILLAQIHHENEDDKQAAMAADAALLQNPDNPDALLYRAVAAVGELVRANTDDVAQWKTARAMIVKANRADPENPYPLFHYYKSFQQQGIRPIVAAGSGLAKAFELLPQDTNLRFTYAQYLIDQNKLVAAKSVFKPMAYAPHSGSGGNYARSMVEKLDRAIKAGGSKADFYRIADEPEAPAP